MTSAEGYFLIAHVVNAIPGRAEVEWEVASETTDGRWITNGGMEVFPIETLPIDRPTPPIPESWLNHLADLADKLRRPKVDLIETLGLAKPTANLPPIVRRL